MDIYKYLSYKISNINILNIYRGIYFHHRIYKTPCSSTVLHPRINFTVSLYIIIRNGLKSLLILLITCNFHFPVRSLPLNLFFSWKFWACMLLFVCYIIITLVLGNEKIYLLKFNSSITTHSTVMY
jgi:hypothetical protein